MYNSRAHERVDSVPKRQLSQRDFRRLVRWVLLDQLQRFCRTGLDGALERLGVTGAPSILQPTL